MRGPLHRTEKELEKQPMGMRGGKRENRVAVMSWDEVGGRLEGGAAAILPVGAAAKEHGFHLPMNTDQIQAEYLAGQIAGVVDALIWPTVTYGFYPAFINYAGSASLTRGTFEAVIWELASELLRFGPRALLVLNTGISTVAPIDAALARLVDRRKAHHLRSNAGPRFRAAVSALAEQPRGTHADEVETSVMLALAPQVVRMLRAQGSPEKLGCVAGAMTPCDPASPGYSPSGCFGQPELATAEKGRMLLEAMTADLIEAAREASAQ